MNVAYLRHVFELIINPFFIGMLLLVVATIGLWLFGDSRTFRGCLLLSLFILLIISTGWVPGGLLNLLENQYEIVSKVNPDIHWVVVLGGGHHEEHPGAPANDEVTPASLQRLVEGVRLYRQLPQAKLLLSGGVGGIGHTSEATYLGVVASWFSIPKNDIVLEKISINTADEAMAIKPLVKQEAFYLVTSAYHMPRAMALCRQQGLHPIAAPTGQAFYWENSGWENLVLPNQRNMSYASTSWHEVLGLLWGKMHGLL